MKMLIRNPRLVFLLLLGFTLVGLSGCATDEPDNMAVRPWNSPKSWENGLPSGMTEGR
jgi:hypothetical protein